jgi:hypothetical protein
MRFDTHRSASSWLFQIGGDAPARPEPSFQEPAVAKLVVDRFLKMGDHGHENTLGKDEEASLASVAADGDAHGMLI